MESDVHGDSVDDYHCGMRNFIPIGWVIKVSLFFLGRTEIDVHKEPRTITFVNPN